MKKVNFFSRAFLLLSFIVFSYASRAQESVPEIYFEIDCIKVKSDDFMPVMKELGNAYNKQLIKEKTIYDWFLIRVEYPSGSDCECDYRAITVFDNMADLDVLRSRKSSMATASIAFKDQSMDHIFDRVDDAAEFVSSTIYRLRDEIVPGPQRTQLAFVNFMDVPPGGGQNYRKIESEIWKPMHKKNVENGILKDWLMFSKEIPYGSETGADYLTFDLFDSYENTGKMNLPDVFAEVHKGKELGEEYQKTIESRELKKVEVWRLILSSSEDLETASR